MIKPKTNTSSPYTGSLIPILRKRKTPRIPQCSSSAGATLTLPAAVQAVLDAIPSHAIPATAAPLALRRQLTIADTGATNHMFPDRSAFISYHKSSHVRVCLGNNTYTPVLGTGTAIVSLNG